MGEKSKFKLLFVNVSNICLFGLFIFACSFRDIVSLYTRLGLKLTLELRLDSNLFQFCHLTAQVHELHVCTLLGLD